MVSFAYLIGSALLSIPLGNLSDRLGRKPFAILGCVVAGIGLLSLPITSLLGSSNAVLIGVSAILLVVGLGHATYTASTNAYVGDIVSTGNLGSAYGILQFARYSSFSFGPAMGGIVATFLGRESTFYISAVLLLGAGFTAAISMSDLRKIPIISTLREAGISKNPMQKSIMAMNDIGIHNHHYDGGDFKTFWRALNTSVIGTALITTFFMAVGVQAFRTFVPSFGSMIGTADLIIGLLISIQATSSILVAIPMGRFADLTGRRMSLLVAGLMVAAFSLGLLFVVPETSFLIVWSLVFGMAIAMTRVSQAIMIAEKTTIGNRGATMGTNHALEHMGYGFGALMGGFLISIFGFVSAFRAFTFLLIVVAFVFYFFARWKNIK